MIVNVSLPWPSADTSPNARGHWSTAAKAKAAQRGHAQAMTHQAMAAQGLCKGHFAGATAAHVSIVFHAPDKRRRDIDNCLASIKAALDGIADAIGIDDGLWSYTIKRGDVVVGGRVDVTITV